MESPVGGNMGNIGDIYIENVKKKYEVDGEEVTVLDNVSLHIKEGEIVSLIGHSGCGKSTLLRIISGLETCQSGVVRIGEQEIREPGEDMGMIFQDHRLLPWFTVYQNLAYGYYEKDKNQKIMEHLKLVGLKGYENAYPGQLSGGMSQRASIARALIHHPKVLLLDEPFGALDALTRIQMQKEMLRIWESEKTTMILVTHDIDEAIYLSNRIVVLDQKPAKVKAIVDVPLARPRNRVDDDFAYVRHMVYEEFFEEEERKEDYVI